MATTLIDAVIDGLVTTLRASSSLDAPGGTLTPVFDGPSLLDASVRDRVVVGWDGSEDSTLGAESTSEWLDLGASARRQESGNVALVVTAEDGDGDVSATRARAFTILGYVEAAIRAAPKLGVTALSWAEVSRVSYAAYATPDGAAVDLSVAVTYEGVI